MYKTKQSDMILDFFKKNPDDCYSAKEIIENKDLKIGEATVYRLLSKLSEQGSLNKFLGDKGAVYKYNECKDKDPHFHLKCTDCGHLIHADCGFLGEIENHLKEDHNFMLDSSKVTLYGICDECRKGKSK
jgi:Fur family ferric uptake transcriptional regulator